jgi:hypothetical protein
MNPFDKQINNIELDIVRQQARLELLKRIAVFFEDVEFNTEVYVYAAEYSGGGGWYCEFSPVYGEDANKDLQPLVHSICQKLNVDFTRERSYDGETIDYRAEFKSTINDNKFVIKVGGVVPGSCRVEETTVALTDEEIKEAQQKALSEVKTERIIRKIVCD